MSAPPTATGASTHAEALALLRRLTARPDVEFRDGQWEAVERLVDRRSRLLVVQRTGWGKSAVYFVATALLRARGAGPTVLVSPLLALMRNQQLMADRAGVRAVAIHSDNRDDWSAIEQRLRDDDVDLLLVAPERFENDRFRADVLPSLVPRVGMLVVDEAHCISDWGHDFRPSYRRISRLLPQLPDGVPVLCTTATANDRVVGDVVEQIGHGIEVIRGELGRDSLGLAVVDLPGVADRLAWLAATIPELPGSGIVYCLTIRDAERVSSWLCSQGIDAVAYSGESEGDDRVAVEEALLGNTRKAVVATSALGMGFDKPDLPWVVHFQSPGSAVAYYQQVGRAGRAVDDAVGVLLRGSEDADIQDWFIETAFPSRAQAERIVGLLSERAGRPVKISEIEQAVNTRRGRIDHMLRVLALEGAVEKADGGGWLRTSQPWAYDQERVDRVTQQRRDEQQAMRDYAATTGCRMRFLREQLDDPEAADCGRCDTCTGRSWARPLDRSLVAAAVTFLRGARLVVEPRRQWQPGLDAPRGRIPAEKQLAPGRSLGLSGDGGWGTLVARRRRALDRAAADVIRPEPRSEAGMPAGEGEAAGVEPYPDELLAALGELARSWQPSPAPAWVTWVPSARDPHGVEAAARAVGDALGLTVVSVLARTFEAPPQSQMENGAFQLRNVWGAFAVVEQLPPGPVVLVDDVADSRWTLTVAGTLLLEHGADAVHPLVLAQNLGG